MSAGEGHACTGRLDRRTFLLQVGGFAGAVLVSLGASPTALHAMIAEVRVDSEATLTGGARRLQYTFPTADGGFVDADNEVLLVRWSGRIYAFALGCRHRGTTIRWQGDGAFCPKHKARFSPDGSNVGGRKTRALDRYSIQRNGDRLVVELDAPLEEDANPTAWAAAWVPAG